MKRLDHPRILRITKFERTVLVLWTLSANESFRGHVVVVLKAHTGRKKRLVFTVENWTSNFLRLSLVIDYEEGQRK